MHFPFSTNCSLLCHLYCFKYFISQNLLKNSRSGLKFHAERRIIYFAFISEVCFFDTIHLLCGFVYYRISFESSDSIYPFKLSKVLNN